ncbi:MAG: hypothetical protein RIS84_1547 [Pseudomonadota bacterium]
MKKCYFISAIFMIVLSVAVYLLQQKQNIEYVKLTPTETGNKFVPIDITSLLTRAKEALSKNELQTAGLYFGSALKQAQGDVTVLSQYYQSMQDYAMRLGKTDAENAIRLLSEMDGFLRTQAVYLSKPQDLESLQKTFTELTKHKQELTTVLANRTTQQKQQLVTASDALLANKPDTISVSDLEKVLAGLRDLNTELLSAEDKTSVQKKVAALEQFNAAIETEASKKRTSMAMNELLGRANAFIEKALKEPAKSNFTLYYINAADAMLKQTVLVESEINDDAKKAEVAKLSDRLEQAKLDISEKQSKLVWDKIDEQANKFEAFNEKYKKTPKQFKEQDGIDELNKLYVVITENMGQLTSDTYLRKAKDMLQKVNKVSTQWQESQRKAYDVDTMQQIKAFHEVANSRLHITGDDKNALYGDMLSYLAPIDTRLLSFVVSTAYQEAFSKFYAKFSDDQKVIISSNMLLANKKKLSDF